jgi:glyoxylase-like metal-dependent hydrolase (beta-lactamase superfamily II)
MIFSPKKTGKFNENLFIIKDIIANYFFYKKGNSSILIDTGYGMSSPDKFLKKHELDKSSVKAIFLTHSDIDHMGGLKYFPDIPVYLGKGEEKLIKREIPRFIGIKYNKKIKREYKLISKENIIIGDIKIEAIPTPGHTLGHTAYIIDNRYMFTGDLLKIKNRKIFPFYKILNMDNKKVEESVNLIMNLTTDKILFTAHFGYIDFKNEKQ